jgi:two-component system cell cycle sensor histidine kinase/response regulator CckA
MSTEEVRILFIEDSPQDVEIEERELRKGGLAFTSLRVDKGETLHRALNDFKPALIISDYTLPHMDGLRALKIARAFCPDVPFIFVSGTMGEERAVQSLKEGATDYVIKGRLSSLHHAVERALKDVRDKIEHRKLEEQLRQAQKMEAIGRLAAGVAHDFNNLLTVITGYAQVVRDRLPLEDSSREDLEEVVRASERAGSLTRQLLAFGRKQVLRPRVLDLNSIVRDLEKMLRRVIGKNVAIEMTLDPALGRVHADQGQMEQVILNLAVNARDAMPEGGTLTIETRNMEVKGRPGPAQETLAPGPYVTLVVGDTGCGMSEEVKAHLFEPFFTTKEVGKGTGLGLSTVYGIVRQSAGSITVHSEPGRGTTFKIHLPRSDQPVESPSPMLSSAPKTEGSETILVVEDQEPVRKLIRSILKRKGYTVLEAQGGKEAVAVFQSRGEAVHLLLTDLMLTGMSGRDLAMLLTGARPTLKVLYMSGYAEEAALHQGLLGQGTSFLPKPFTPEDLVCRVRHILDSSG